VVGATASLLPKYWIGINGLTQTKPTNGPYIMVDWQKNQIIDTLPKNKPPESLNEFMDCVSKVFPTSCKLVKTSVTSGNKVKHVLKLMYHSVS
jgi:hypothetical protein